MKLVEIEWLDAVKEESHIPLEEAGKLTYMLCRHVGYVVREDRKEIVITWGILENQYNKLVAVDEAFSIPKPMIIRIRGL